MAWPMPFVPPVTRTRLVANSLGSAEKRCAVSGQSPDGNLPLVEREDEAEVDGATWEVARDAACDCCFCVRLGRVGDGESGGLGGRPLHPFANGWKAAPFVTFILDDGALGEGADHGVDIVIIVPGEIRRQWFC